MKRIVSVVVFILLFFILYVKVSWVLKSKVRDADAIETFYKTPKDTYDVVFVGSSHVYYAIYPMQLWKNYGFASYDAASPSQAVPCSYYLIRDVIRNQHPKVVVMDMYYMVYNRYANEYSRIHEISDAMPLFSRNKVEMIRDLVPKVEGDGTQWSFYANIALYHARWQELTTKDFYISDLFMKGAKTMSKARPVKKTEISDNRVDKIPEIPLEYLQKIKQVCDENDTELLLISIPYGNENQDKMEDQLAILNGIEKYVKENGMTYLNLFKRDDLLSLDYTQDFYEPAHMNRYGGRKVTDCLGRYLTENYDLPDHRGEARYASWNDDYLLFEARMNE